MSRFSDSDTAVLAARVTLLALHATLVDAPEFTRAGYIIPPGSRPLSLEAAVHELVEVPKPVSCQAEMQDGSILVRWRAVPSKVMLQADWEWLETVVDFLAASPRRGQSSTLEPPGILVEGSSDRLHVPIAALARWVQDYEVNGLSRSLYRIERERESAAADGVLLRFDSPPERLWEGLT